MLLINFLIFALVRKGRTRYLAAISRDLKRNINVTVVLGWECSSLSVLYFYPSFFVSRHFQYLLFTLIVVIYFFLQQDDVLLLDFELGGLSRNAVFDYETGFVPADWNRTVEFLINNGKASFKDWKNQKKTPLLSNHEDRSIYAYLMGRMMILIQNDHSDRMLNVGCQARMFGEAYCALNAKQPLMGSNSKNSLKKQIDELKNTLPPHIEDYLTVMRENGNSVVHLDITTMDTDVKKKVIRAVYSLGKDVVGYLLSSAKYRDKANQFLPPVDSTIDSTTKQVGFSGEYDKYFILSCEEGQSFSQSRGVEILRLFNRMLNKQLSGSREGALRANNHDGVAHLDFESDQALERAFVVLTKVLAVKEDENVERKVSNLYYGVRLYVRKKKDEEGPAFNTKSKTKGTVEKRKLQLILTPAKPKTGGESGGRLGGKIYNNEIIKMQNLVQNSFILFK